MIWGVFLIVGVGVGYVLGRQRVGVRVASLEHQLREAAKAQAKDQYNWKEFCGCLSPVFPVFIGQLKAVIQETEQAASGLIQRFHKIAKQARESALETEAILNLGEGHGDEMSVERILNDTKDTIQMFVDQVTQTATGIHDKLLLSA